MPSPAGRLRKASRKFFLCSEFRRIVQLIVSLIFIGFPIALVLAWAFELTGEGLKRTEDAHFARPRAKSHAWIYVAVIGAVLSFGLFFLGRDTAGPAQHQRSRLR